MTSSPATQVTRACCPRRVCISPRFRGARGAFIALVVALALSGCVDRNRQAAIERMQLVVDEQHAKDAECATKLAAAVDVKVRADVAFDCKEKRAAQLERYKGLLTMVLHPSSEEHIAAFPDETQAIKDAPIDGDGKRLFMTRQCIVCHSIDGTALVGGSAAGLYGSEVVHTDGSVAVVDDAYLREAILTPNLRVTKGYVPTMPEYGKQFNTATADVIIEYIKTLNSVSPDHNGAAPLPTP